jgi:hypothetical protein
MRGRLLLSGSLIFGLVVFLQAVQPAPLKVRIVRAGPAYQVEINTPRFINTELLKILKAGVTISAVYEIRVFRKNALSLYIFPYKSYVFRKSIDHNVQNDIYSLNLLGDVRRSNDLSGSLEDFYRNELLDLKGCVLEEPAAKYFCKIRFRMEELKLYPPLSLVVNMVDAYRYATDWVETGMEQENESTE